MLNFVKKTSTPGPARTSITWFQMVQRPGTTALVPMKREARPGMYITHKDHGKVKLLAESVPNQLKIQLKSGEDATIVYAEDCGPPFSASVKLQDDSFDDARMGFLREEVAGWEAYDQIYITHFKSPTASSKAAGKRVASEPEQPSRNKGGRPLGSKDKQPRKLRAKEITWEYTGRRGPVGLQSTTFGKTVRHDGLGNGILVQQPDPSHFTLSITGDDDGVESLVTVTVNELQAVTDSQSEPAAESGRSLAGGSTAGSSVGASQPVSKRKAGKRKRVAATELPPQQLKRAKRAEIVEKHNRKKREATAEARGKPLKAASQQLNQKWAPELRQQAVQLFYSRFAPKDFQGCARHLLGIPGFTGVTRGHVQGWVASTQKLAVQEPNEFGLVVTTAGRQPELPKALYEELKEQIVALAKTKAFTLNATTLRPIALAFVVTRLGPDVIRSSRGGFTCGRTWITALAKAAKLKWRKPFGDARKHPPDADAQIQDMKMRLAYLMHEYDVPPALTLNFDQTGLHFMQMRGNTWTVVEEDLDTAHASRQGKGKEVKQQNKGDKRQATGTVGSSMAGDVLPGQLIVQGTPNRWQTQKGSLPQLDGNKYSELAGGNAGHKIGFRPTQSTSNSAAGQLTRTWLGHLVQTSNHWANIQTSYAILEYIIVPWLLQKKAAIGKPADAVCILIVDCWYGWKDQDKKKTLITFRHYVRNHYPWLRLLFVPAACTDLVQPADRGYISWLKACMRAFYTDVISKAVLEQLKAGTELSKIQINTSAPYLKGMLAKSFAKALSELPREKVVACWGPLQEAVCYP